MDFDFLVIDVGLKVDIVKTEILIVSKGKKEDMRLDVEGEYIKNMKDFKYHGNVFEGSAGMNKKKLYSRIGPYGGDIIAIYTVTESTIIEMRLRRLPWRAYWCQF